MNNEDKKDGRSNNGGFRSNAGRKKGSGTETVNKVVRMPKQIIDEANKKGVKNLTKLLVKGAQNELDKLGEKKGKATKRVKATPATNGASDSQ